jgi:hypothetical protein
MALRLRCGDQFPTSCSPDSRMTTVAVISASTPDQLQTALSLASRVLRPASQLNNSARLVVFGSLLSQTPKVSSRITGFLADVLQNTIDPISGAKLDSIDLVISAHDLNVLRFLDSYLFGQLCTIPGDAEGMEKAIECLVRPIDIDFKDTSELPPDWAEYVKATKGLAYFKDLWSETHKKKDSVPAKDPSKALTLAMFSKMAMMAGHTAAEHVDLVKKAVRETKGAIGLGLMEAFPVVDEARSCITFLKAYIVDDPPWTLNQRGEAASEVASIVLEKVFSHAASVASVLENGKLAVVIGQEAGRPATKDGLVLIDSGVNESIGKLLAANVPTGVGLVNKEFNLVQTKQLNAEEWASNLNEIVPKAIEALKGGSEDKKVDAGIRALLGVIAALSSSDLHVPEDIADSSFDSIVSSHSRASISSYPCGLAAHVSHELVIHSNRIECEATGAHIGLQNGPCVSCTFASFCPTTGKALRTSSFSPVGLKDMDVVETQRVIDEIASSIDNPYRPLGSLIGILGSTVEKNGELARVVFWKRKGENRDSIVTFIPSVYVDVVFADYATQSRNLLQSESEFDGEHAHHGHAVFAADTVFSLSTASAIRGSDGRVFTVPKLEELGLLGQDETALYRSFANGIVDAEVNTELPSALDSSFESYYVRESTSDRLCGLKVGWAVIGESYCLVSANEAHEKVSY